MKFAVAKEHRDFFHKHFRIEFNHLFSIEQCNQLMIERSMVLSGRLNVSKTKLKHVSANDQFMAGFDLWRGNATLKKIILQKKLAEIAAELLEVKALRIGYDQLIPFLSATNLLTPDDSYRTWLSKTLTLQEISSVQGLMAGLIICIQAPQVMDDTVNSETISKTMAIASLFTTSLGNGVYFSPSVPLDFSDLAARKDYTYLMITYTKGTSVYYKNDNDPHTNFFREFSYNFGDRLSDRYHPLVVF